MNPTFDNGNTLLHFAVNVCQLEVCKLLLENIQDKNPANDVQSTPLHWAVVKARNNSHPHYHLEICKLLWSHVEDKNAVLNMVNMRSGKTLKEELALGRYKAGETEKVNAVKYNLNTCEEVFKMFNV